MTPDDLDKDLDAMITHVTETTLRGREPDRRWLRLRAKAIYDRGHAAGFEKNERPAEGTIKKKDLGNGLVEVTCY